MCSSHEIHPTTDRRARHCRSLSWAAATRAPPMSGCRRRTCRPSSRCWARCCSTRMRSPRSLALVKGHDSIGRRFESIFERRSSTSSGGEPADAITVADELTKRGDLSRVGGASYLHELMQSVPTAANASYYAGSSTSERCCAGSSRPARGSSRWGMARARATSGHRQPGPG